jgi:hypothetical protein
MSSRFNLSTRPNGIYLQSLSVADLKALCKEASIDYKGVVGKRSFIHLLTDAVNEHNDHIIAMRAAAEEAKELEKKTDVEQGYADRRKNAEFYVSLEKAFTKSISEAKEYISEKAATIETYGVSHFVRHYSERCIFQEQVIKALQRVKYLVFDTVRSEATLLPLINSQIDHLLERLIDVSTDSVVETQLQIKLVRQVKQMFDRRTENTTHLWFSV